MLFCMIFSNTYWLTMDIFLDEQSPARMDDLSLETTSKSEAICSMGFVRSLDFSWIDILLTKAEDWYLISSRMVICLTAADF